jgi:hypothetical protein
LALYSLKTEEKATQFSPQGLPKSTNTSPIPALCDSLPGPTGTVEVIPKIRPKDTSKSLYIMNKTHSLKYVLYSNKISQLIILKYFIKVMNSGAGGHVRSFPAAEEEANAAPVDKRTKHKVSKRFQVPCDEISVPLNSYISFKNSAQLILVSINNYIPLTLVLVLN